MTGLFISFEGGDGSGKSTISKMIYQELKKRGYQVIYTREPGGIDISEKIRSIILDPNNSSMDSKTEALLYAASRRQHLVEKVIPALKLNKIVISDRFIDSSLAYQGFARKIGFDEILQLNKFAIDEYFPDATIYFELDEEIGLSRTRRRGKLDRLEIETKEFHTLVKEGYQEVLARFPNRIKIVDASKSIDEVYQDSIKLVEEIIDEQKYFKE